MTGLFDKDPAFRDKKRDRKGRFATAERAMCDKATKENSWLRLQVEKYRRIAHAAGGAFVALQKTIDRQKREIADLREELARVKNHQNKTVKC
jgi:hypothetical protein